MAQRSTPQRDDLTAEEAAAELRVAPNTIRVYCRTGKLPGAYRVGQRWRVPRVSLGYVTREVTPRPMFPASGPGSARDRLRARGLID